MTEKKCGNDLSMRGPAKRDGKERENDKEDAGKLDILSYSTKI